MPKVATTEVTEVTEVKTYITLTKGYFKLFIPEIASVTSVTSVTSKKPSKKGYSMRPNRTAAKNAERQEGMSLVAGTPIIDVLAPHTRQQQKKAEQRPEVIPLAPEEIAHRKGFWEFVETHGAPWHKQHLGRLLGLWRQWNQEFYDSSLVEPYVLLNEPVAPNVYGSCARISGFGGRSQICIRPSLLTGTHRDTRSEDVYAEGRFLLVADVLLHESIHQWLQEEVGDPEDAYHGHGPLFRDKANEIGERLGLPMVRTSKNRSKKDKTLPSCSQWPHNVRDVEHYQGAYHPRGSVCSTQALCAAATRYAKERTDKNLLELGRVAVAYHASLEAKQVNHALHGNKEDVMSLLAGT